MRGDRAREYRKGEGKIKKGKRNREINRKGRRKQKDERKRKGNRGKRKEKVRKKEQQKMEKKGKRRGTRNCKQRQHAAKPAACCTPPTLVGGENRTERGQDSGKIKIALEHWTKIQWEVPLFYRYPNFLKNSVGYVKGNLHAKNQLDPSIRFNRTPTCERQILTDSGP